MRSADHITDELAAAFTGCSPAAVLMHRIYSECAAVRCFSRCNGRQSSGRQTNWAKVNWATHQLSDNQLGDTSWSTGRQCLDLFYLTVCMSFVMFLFVCLSVSYVFYAFIILVHFVTIGGQHWWVSAPLAACHIVIIVFYYCTNILF